jgi:predicted ATPase with chaperone activity
VERITANFAPAHLKKQGAEFGLPIVMGILSTIMMSGSFLEMPGVQGSGKMY